MAEIEVRDEQGRFTWAAVKNLRSWGYRPKKDEMPQEVEPDLGEIIEGLNTHGLGSVNRFKEGR